MKKALLIGEYEGALYHPLTGVDAALGDILAGEFVLDIRADYDKLTEEALCRYDLLISYVDVGCYDKKANAALTAAILRFVLAGGGLFAIHNGIFLQYSPELAMALGARLTKHPPYTMLQVEVSNPEHPIVRGVEDFVMGDEPYTFEMDCFTPRTPLLAYRYGDERFPAAWCHAYGRGRVAYVSLGHEESSLRNASLRRIVRQAAVWSAGADEKEESV